LYWSKRGFGNHRHVGHAKVVVKFHVPPTRKPKKGEFAIIAPWAEDMINFLVDGAIKQWMAEQSTSPAKSSSEVRRGRQRKRPHVKPDYDVLTVNEAVARFGMDRDALIRDFENAQREYAARLQRREERRLARQSQLTPPPRST
jgi:hypothetical protein